MSRSTIRRSLATVVAVVALGATACGVSAQDDASNLATGGGSGSGSSGQTKAPEAPAKGSFEGTGGAVSLRKAATATAEVETQKTALTMTIEGVPTVGELEISAQGEFDNQSRQGRMTMDMGDLFGSFGETGGDVPAGAGKVEMVVDGDTIYMKSPLFEAVGQDGKPWVKVDAADLAQQGAMGGSAQSDPAAFLKFLEGAGDEIVEVGTEAVRGVETTHVTTNIDLAKLLEQAEAGERGALEEQLKGLGADAEDLPSIPAEAWIDGDGYVRKFSMAFDLSSLAGSGTGSEGLDGAKMSMSVELYDFDEPVDITIPPAAQVGELDPSILGGGN